MNGLFHFIRSSKICWPDENDDQFWNESISNGRFFALPCDSWSYKFSVSAIERISVTQLIRYNVGHDIIHHQSSYRRFGEPFLLGYKILI